jgi:NAD(P)-dependent dehydrogenase (short-subunit alcohol dehydrogenase family)
MAVPGGGAAAPWRLDDRVALVTGASAGLGARFARVLHQAGAHVLATAAAPTSWTNWPARAASGST